MQRKTVVFVLKISFYLQKRDILVILLKLTLK